MMRGLLQRFLDHFEVCFAAAILAAAWLYYPYCQSGPPLCIWKKLFGIGCPGCGLTRGLCFLMHGRWAEAIKFNPLSLLVFGILAANLMRGCTGIVAGGYYGRRRFTHFAGLEPAAQTISHWRP